MKNKIEQLLDNMIERPQSYCSTTTSFEESYLLLSYVLYDKLIIEDMISFVKFKNPKIPGPIASITTLANQSSDLNFGVDWDLFMGLFTEFHHELKKKYLNK